MHMGDQSRAGKAHMSPEFLLPETTIREAGAGPEISLDDQQGKALVLTLGIMRIIEQESLDLSIRWRRFRRSFTAVRTRWRSTSRSIRM
jgi:hypothetical protein